MRTAKFAKGDTVQLSASYFETYPRTSLPRGRAGKVINQTDRFIYIVWSGTRYPRPESPRWIEKKLEAVDDPR